MYDVPFNAVDSCKASFRVMGRAHPARFNSMDTFLKERVSADSEHWLASSRFHEDNFI